MRVGLEILLLTVLIGTLAVTAMRLLYPSVEVGEYVTLVTILSILLAIGIDAGFHRWKKRSGGTP